MPRRNDSFGDIMLNLSLDHSDLNPALQPASAFFVFLVPLTPSAGAS